MPKPKPSTISRDPYAFIGTPPARQEEPKAEEPPALPVKKPATEKPVTEKITTPFPHALIERARDAAYWERATLTGIVVQALAEALDKMERERGRHIRHARRVTRRQAGRYGKRP